MIKYILKLDEPLLLNVQDPAHIFLLNNSIWLYQKIQPSFFFLSYYYIFLKVKLWFYFCKLLQFLYQIAGTWIKKTNKEGCNHLHYVFFYTSEVGITIEAVVWKLY